MGLPEEPDLALFHINSNQFEQWQPWNVKCSHTHIFFALQVVVVHVKIDKEILLALPRCEIFLEPSFVPNSGNKSSKSIFVCNKSVLD